MSISYQIDGVVIPRFSRKRVSLWITEVAKQHGKEVGEIAYLFCDDEQILSVNRQYLQHDYYTDIITFDYSESNIISGDIFISIDTVRSNAKTYSVPLQEEFLRVIIHGVLHLCGIDDKSEEAQAEMTQCENSALALWKAHHATTQR